MSPFHGRVPVGAEFLNVTFTRENVFRVMRKLKRSKSSGPDGIPCDLFKMLASHLSLLLCILFNYSLSVGKIPVEWRNAIISPVAKGGLASDVSNYRPISLSSCACKIISISMA